MSSERDQSVVDPATIHARELRAPGNAESPLEQRRERCEPLVQDGVTVLVVDDERAVRAIVAVALEALGHRVLTAAGGREACELYAQHRGCIQLVMLDLTMPEMNGEQTFLALREQDANVRALLMTGYAEDEVRDSFSLQPFAGFLAKPFSRRALASAVHAALKSSSRT